MPRIESFAACEIRINFNDHMPPYFHVLDKRGREWLVRIDNGAVLEGRRTARDPRRARMGGARREREAADAAIFGVSTMSNRRDHFRVKSLKALADARLRLAFRDGLTVEVDLKPWIKASKHLRPLAEPALFATARLAGGGRVVEFGDGAIDLATDNLRNLATEQASGIGHERLWNWMHANELTVARPPRRSASARACSSITATGKSPFRAMSGWRAWAGKR